MLIIYICPTHFSLLTIDEKYMYRCLELAKLGAGNVAPNPMVGAVLVCNDRIIGEGYHQKYGEAHAEPNCIQQAIEGRQRDLIPQSTLYVSLEPCAHLGKTPPCVDLIIKSTIPKVVVGCRDPFKEVNGKGIEKLREAGIEVETGVLEENCKESNKRFLHFHTQYRPYVILKWAQTGNGKISAGGEDRLTITNEFTNRIVHKWRSEESALLVGTNTALMDDPLLTTRFWTGNNPIRLVVDMNLRLPPSLKIFNDDAPTIVFNKIKHDLDEKFFDRFFLRKVHCGLFFYQVTEDVSLVHQITNALYRLKIQSVIVEGGARLLQSFIDEAIWDEARIINNRELIIHNGLAAPQLRSCKRLGHQRISNDSIEIFKPAF